MEEGNNNNNNLPDDPDMPALLGRKKKREAAAVRKLRTDFLDGEMQYKRNRVQKSRTIDDHDAKLPAVEPVVVVEEEGTKEQQKKEKKKVPEPSRSLIENQFLSDLIHDHAVCRKCKRVCTLKLTFPSVSITSIPTLTCANSTCGAANKSDVSKTSLPGWAYGDKVTDFAANVLFVVSYLSSGDGGSEAQHLLALLGLPHAQSMEKETFQKIEKATSPYLLAIVDKCLKDSLFDEVLESMGDDPDFDFDKWKLAVENKTELPPDQCAEIVCSMDMGWQKKGSGRRCDSISGHACLIGMQKRKPLAFCLKIKSCPICDRYEGQNVPQHNCQKNHSGSSGSMESSALLDMMVDLFNNKHTSVVTVITDDDTTMKGQTKWSNADYEKNVGVPRPRIQLKDGKTKAPPDHGKLPGNIPQPKFLADPAHGKKILRNRLYAVTKRKVADRHGMNEADVIRIQTNFIYMANQLTLLDKSEWPDAGKAVLEHHFDEHKFCGDFCRRGEELKTNTESPEKKYYRSKEADKELYHVLKEIVDELITIDRLAEVSHGHDTNVSKALNNIISWVAPKNKTYSFGTSLRTRICIAVSVFCIGFEEFYSRLFDQLGVQMDEATAYYLSTKERNRQARIQRSKSFDAKKKRNAKVHAKLKEYADNALKDKSSGDGYATGIALDGDKAANEDSSVPVAVPTCRSCGEAGHKTSNNKKCKNFKPRKKKERMVCASDAEQQFMMDSIPLISQTKESQKLVSELSALVDDDEETE